ncbi:MULTISPECIES: class I adenylate-forming enzyme family protein [Alphaproteobacteria]|jgi:acyl-CoA synthetase (AMP-forming)/AMP-acid ligase II|uniref:Long-chain-fatty-acid--CoA ligase n=1 Tax=Sulfitobacter pontiacus TaxID=60137 RepID=A0AAX3AEN2_9RHOB|nr:MULTISPECIES: AMP-binding protein [Sulfitobacter]AXI52458.1 acid--CoA ligase [Sulfitobacter sp. SK025]UOA24647.1 Long-chain-fatty-acid--CoA ligase [Sulfitobacter pontiacus]WPZ27011.1 AMP-binding protein [Sulfitobacter pontiacus]HJO50519.1 AMP-binding protein [Sulfitobacter pontiacus]|tara:strand:+ start:63900 stop:65435 length:1536 start_codon:yes stop_codon:yes gene_type:complete
MLPEVMRAGRADLYSIFRTRVRNCAEALAVEDGSNRLTYAELHDRVDRLASVFLARGIAPGDRIAILSHNRAEYLELQLAASGIGAIVACLNWRLAPDELRHCVELVEPVLALVEPGLKAAYQDIASTPCLEIGPELESALAGARPDARVGTLVDDPEAGLTILYTSGTTGLPKGALISHRAHIARSMVFAAQLALDPGDGFIAWAPMFHMASTDHALATLLRGGTVVMVDGLQSAVINAALSRHKVGWFVMMPGTLEAFIAERRANPLPVKGIKVCGAMADLVPPHQIAELTGLLDTPYLNSFGATETGLPPGTADLIAPGVVPKTLSKRVSAFCEVRLVDPDGDEVPVGMPGEMAVRGPTLFSGYWNADDTNARDFRNGFFHMGDLFRRNSDGTIDFVDRAKYLIKTGGENVYPAEIERVLLAHPRVVDAAVVRAFDAKWGESPVAFVACVDGGPQAQELMQLCREYLAGYKRPREIRFISFDDFPRSTSGKVQRHVLEARLNDEESCT